MICIMSLYRISTCVSILIKCGILQRCQERVHIPCIVFVVFFFFFFFFFVSLSINFIYELEIIGLSHGNSMSVKQR
uniref:Uncharacterized protein n=1 Tax=Manihot esculenta TaxID=3983 RepID=A0A2C9U6K0_MANES